MNKAPENLVLNNRCALGDAVVFSALVRDIALAYPGRFNLYPQTNFSAIWQNNPHVAATRLRDHETGTLSPPPRFLKFLYKQGIIHAGRAGTDPAHYDYCHFLPWFHRDFHRQTGLAVPTTKAGGDLHLTEAEKQPLVKGRYWIVMSGGKLDVTNKYWPTTHWQELADLLAAIEIPIVQAGATYEDSRHPALDRVYSMVGRTDNPRDFLSLIHGAEGVICGVTSAMHICAALEKPCVVVAGGREEPWWENYSQAYQQFGPGCPPPKIPHRFLHTLGLPQFPCCEKKGCWKKKTIPLPGDKHGNQSTCRLPVMAGSQPVAQCMRDISPARVVEAVISYYLDGTLRPV